MIQGENQNSQTFRTYIASVQSGCRDENVLKSGVTATGFVTSDDPGLLSPCKVKLTRDSFQSKSLQETERCNGKYIHQVCLPSTLGLYQIQGQYTAPQLPLDSCFPAFAKHSLHNVTSAVDHSYIAAVNPVIITSYQTIRCNFLVQAAPKVLFCAFIFLFLG